MASDNENTERKRLIYSIVNMCLCDSQPSCHLTSRVYRKYEMMQVSFSLWKFLDSSRSDWHL